SIAGFSRPVPVAAQTGFGGMSPGPGGAAGMGAPVPQPAPQARRQSPLYRDVDPSAATIVEVAIEGNATIPDYAIRQQLSVRPGRAPSPSQVSDDVRKLLETKWFSSVSPIYRQVDNGVVLVFRVMERPVVRSVEFRGNKKIKEKLLVAETGLRPNAPFDVSINREAAQRIKSLYKEKGYMHATVDLEKGGDPLDREVIFVINEGPKVKVRSVSVEGNSFVRDGVIKIGKQTKPAILYWIGGNYDPESVPNDEQAIEQYYQNLGFFDVAVTSETKWVDDEKSRIDVVFHVKEGQRYRVRNKEMVGFDVLTEQQLNQDLKMVAGKEFNARFLREDVEKMKGQYDELGRLFSRVEPQIVFLQQAGWVDLVYHIDEDEPKYIGDINIHIRGDYPHTKEDVVRNQAHQFVKPGTLAKASSIRKLQARLNGSQLWDRAQPVSVDIRRVDGSDYLPPSLINRAQSAVEDTDHRAATERDMLSFKPIVFGHSVGPAESPAAVESSPPRSGQLAHPPAAIFGAEVPEFVPAVRSTTSVPRGDESWEPLPANAPAEPTASIAPGGAALWPLSPPELVIRAQSEDDVFRSQSIDAYGQPLPQDYLQGVSPQGDPFGNALRGPIQPGYIDIDIGVSEARTGRLMFGVGINSDAGVVGSIVLEENNFDILRPPRSFADITNGTAWRGGGQSFRIEAVPGNQVSRYLVSWQDPFFMNTDYSLGTSGFYYTRFFQNWTEERLGGRVSLGRLLNNFWSVSGALRLENVQIRDIDTPTPPTLAAVRGDNFLSTVRGAVAHDTRDSAFLPTTGHVVELSYEQGIADFVYPRVELTASQFFTLHERADGRGKHILQLRGQTGWTGDETPIFENFYAGGFQSFRGFEFRGVTPRSAAGIELGGEFMLLGSAEYLIPITADDNIRGVVFTDVGTVESEVTIDNFRASIGAGLRLIIPAMGPAPIALDFAYPLVKESFDEKQIFSFYVGFTR
ncbi:MAG: BamA/TamA family outer membrane protein, partial [Planctomycetaceae bacterium]|nr:BamA/TamA family outer membrane protein [Planctomycetaceae bacterium]